MKATSTEQPLTVGEYRRAVRRVRMVYIKITEYQKKIDKLRKDKENYEIQLKVSFSLSFVHHVKLEEKKNNIFIFWLEICRPSERTLNYRRRKRKRHAAWRISRRGSLRQRRLWSNPTCIGTGTSKVPWQPPE
jgi:hypothetical protein